MRLVTDDEQLGFNFYMAEALRAVACWLRDPTEGNLGRVQGQMAAVEVYVCALYELVRVRQGLD
jgi:hypothetical protein